MQILVLADEDQKKELLSQGIIPDTEVIWLTNPEMMRSYEPASACVDLLFAYEQKRIQLLEKFLPRPVLINSVVHTLQETHPQFIRINAWNTFLQSVLIEGSASSAQQKEAENVLARFHKKIEWLPDIPGFVSPRVISMIINEAYHSLEEGLSTKEEINTAMKLGTNYPFGPFEWAEKIGIEQVHALLQKLSTTAARYLPCTLLQYREAAGDN